MQKFPSQMQDKFTVRFPDGLRDIVAKTAEKNGRSMNSEIVEMIKFALTNESLRGEFGEYQVLKYQVHGNKKFNLTPHDMNLISEIIQHVGRSILQGKGIFIENEEETKKQEAEEKSAD